MFPLPNELTAHNCPHSFLEPPHTHTRTCFHIIQRRNLFITENLICVPNQNKNVYIFTLSLAISRSLAQSVHVNFLKSEQFYMLHYKNVARLKINAFVSQKANKLFDSFRNKILQIN